METKCGLVLSGGGAKGAYEAGVVKALAKLNFEPDVIAGASIGALNGAIVAASPTFADAAETLAAVWTGIDEDEIIKINQTSSTRLMSIIAMNIVLRTALKVNPLALVAYLASKPVLNKLFAEKDRKFIALLDSSPMEELLKNNLDFDRLLGTEGKEFYVSVCPSKGGGFWGTVRDVMRYATNAGESLFPRLKDFDKDEAVKLVLASAAIPPALKAVMIQEKVYRDGGMGKRIEQQGNTPMKPLADIGCKCAIVVMLSQGSLWNRNEWPDIVPIEIRPSFDINEGSLFKAAFNFDSGRIRELMRLGEEDTLRVLGNIAQGAHLIDNLRKSQQELENAQKIDPEKELEYESTMQAIRDSLNRS